jgi:fumarylacetoacetate (FAA) hydrolase family protein
MTATNWPTDAAELLPEDGDSGTLVGRAWVPDAGGPSIVAFREDGVIDVTSTFPTMRALTESRDPAAAVSASTGPVIGTLDDLVGNTPPE